MDFDVVEDRLNRSAPPVGAPLADARLRAMFDESQKRVRIVPRRKGLRVGAGIGVAVALLAGAGAAVAYTSEWGWFPRFDEPDAAFLTTLPSGRVCEVRAVAVDGFGTDPQGADVDPRMREWLESTDFEQILDLPAARAVDAADAASSPGQTLVIGPEGVLMDVQESPAARTPDDVAANVVRLAMEEAIVREVTSLKVDIRVSTISAVIKCDPVTE
ncbi:hypothetical protein [Microbacterium sp. 1.5R]|uniref:hypothetical protein n=1 Tax=Microbacterium sp. 1.5R TaxID=1916917 RepID=UPI00119CA65A|nr:hypothetical protein [Microbacterium sp. 1.5R]